jgi:hypothetical protein
VPLALGLCACGGGSSDGEQVNAVIEHIANDPTSLCTQYATSALLRRSGGQAACLTAASAASAKDPGVKITSLSVNGGSATASITGRSGTHIVRLTKLNGKWMVSGAG